MQLDGYLKSIMSQEEQKVLDAKSKSIVAYSKYVNEHIANVHLAFANFGAKICHDLETKYKGVHGLHSQVRTRVMKHDDSKFTDAEFIPYVQKFYPWEGMDKTPEQVEEEFDKAWMHHCKYNDHHPEHWVQYSELQKRNIYMAMDDAALIEMLIDWIAMSMVRNQSVHTWWTTDKGGREEKKKLMDRMDFEFVDKWIEENKNLIDFSNRNIGDK